MKKPLRKCRGNIFPKLGKFTTHTHPFVIFLWEEIIRQRVSLSSVSEAAGIERANIHKWRDCQKGPYLMQIENVLDVLGYKLKIVRKSEN